MLTLIDGYNLLFSLGMIPSPVKEGDLQRARQSLLTMLADALGEKGKSCTVVFDATRAPSRAPGDTFFKGIDVRFTKRREEADDMIKFMIKQCTVPKQLTVISSDHRLVEAATRKRATSVKADEFLDWLDRQKPGFVPTPTAPQVSPEESAGWLKAFADVDTELADATNFPEESWLKRMQIDENDLGDIRKKHRMKPKE
ncbi:MAG: NYN domain-containing protein [Gemmatales bacterium]